MATMRLLLRRASLVLSQCRIMVPDTLRRLKVIMKLLSSYLHVILIVVRVNLYVRELLLFESDIHDFPVSILLQCLSFAIGAVRLLALVRIFNFRCILQSAFLLQFKQCNTCIVFSNRRARCFVYSVCAVHVDSSAYARFISLLYQGYL